MYGYRGVKDNNAVRRGQKNSNNTFPRGNKPDNILSNKVLNVNREVMNKLVNEKNIL